MTGILDAHLHFWDPSARQHEWLAAFPSLQRRFGPEDLDPGRHTLSGAVFVQADCRDEEAVDEVGWVEGLAEAHPFLCGIVAYAPLHLGRDAQRHVELLAQRPLVVGVRRLLQGQPAKAIMAPALVRGVRMLAEWGLTFDVCVTHDQLPAVVELVRACPRTAFVVDHLGKPPVADGGANHWRAQLARLASHVNVTCKLSGLATEVGPGHSMSELRPYLEYTLEVFGPERCMVGSDWPVLTARATVEQWFDVVVSVTADLSPDERDAVLAGTATATYGLAAPAVRTEEVDDARRAVRR